MFSSVSRCINLVLLVCVAVLLVSYLKKGELPKAVGIRPELLESPLQSTINKKSFELPYFGKIYVVQPLASYDIYGLVVSHNDPTGFGDIYHDETSVDIKDICLIWGENLETDIFHRVQFWSESWTCNAHMSTRETYDAFRMEELSNNHLIASEESIRRKIRSLHVGDQVHFKGMLVNYFEKNYPEAVRRTSLRRNDAGNGACEVVYVESLDVLVPGTPSWYGLYSNSKYFFIYMLVVRLITWVVFPYLEYRSLKVGAAYGRMSSMKPR